MSSAPLYQIKYEIEGIVQGVGFRPAIYRLVTAKGLGGSIKNCSGKVELVLEGPIPVIGEVIASINTDLPAQAKIDSIKITSKEELSSYDPTFKIEESSSGDSHRIVIPADLAMCWECDKEVTDPQNRRYQYPFTTCTDCGPRYTVVNEMPYDRERTTLCEFPLCEECQKEYTNEESRRFHAESIACPQCGPQLFLTDNQGNVIEKKDALKRARREISLGKIVAIRGIGGFLLACNAYNLDALETLRRRKSRPDKPFAVMIRELEMVFTHCNFNANAVKMLMSTQAPIAILDINRNMTNLPIEAISPDTDTLGVMIPYSPLHRLLFKPAPGDTTPAFEVLVMTSGNRGGEPICITNEEAFDRLEDVADFILCHDREINLRNDDSICTFQGSSTQVWRRARGYAPTPIQLDRQIKSDTLAMGAELKNSIAFGYSNQVLISPHIGDLSTPEAIDSQEQIAKYFPNFVKRTPEKVVVDLHPDMHSTRLGESIAGQLQIPIVRVQHHHAHAAAGMLEHNLKEALALTFDGTGYGTDGNIWGGEMLHVTPTGFKRMATFIPAKLPGSDSATFEPRRQLIARLHQAGVSLSRELLNKLGVSDQEAEMWRIQCDKNINSPLTHAAGRLFDSFSALLGTSPTKVSYEGQAAIRLEAYANELV